MIKKGVIIALLFTCIACVQKGPTIDETTVFRYNEHANITSLDPAFARDQRNIWACNLLFNGLVKLDKDLNVVPDLSSHWDLSPDGTTYTFTIKDSIYFHESAFAKARTVTAADFKYSLERLTDPNVASPGAWTMENVQSITVIDPQHLEIKLKEVFPAFLGILSMKYCSVIPKDIENDSYDLRKYPVGTGPFYLKRWEENVKMVLRKNHRYHERDEAGKALPYLEAVAITFKNDKQSEFLEFVQGNLDFINAIDPSYKDELLDPQGNLQERYKDQVNMIKSPFLNTEYLGIQLSSSQALPIAVRKALNQGFDREKMITFLRNNVGIPANKGFVPLGLPGGGQQEVVAYDPAKARKLLVQSGIVPSDYPITIATSANYLDICEFLQKEWQNLGFKVQVEVMPPSSLRQSRSAGNLQVFRSSWIADYPDAQNYLSLFYSLNTPPNGPNYTRFNDPYFDQLYEQSLTTYDDQLREKLYVKMDSIISDQVPVIPLYYDQSVRFISKKVKGLQSNAVNMLDLTRVQKIR